MRVSGTVLGPYTRGLGPHTDISSKNWFQVTTGPLCTSSYERNLVPQDQKNGPTESLQDTNSGTYDPEGRKGVRDIGGNKGKTERGK